MAHAYQVIAKFKIYDTKTEKLKQLMVTARSKRDVVSASSSKKRLKQVKITVSFTWYNYDQKKEKYTQVREIMGGGKRVQILPRTSDKEKLLEAATNLFFPEGRNSKGNRLTNFNYFLADFSLSEIEDENFDLDKYLTKHSLKQTKLSLVTKTLTFQQRLHLISNSTSSSSEDDFEIPTTLHKHSTPKNVSQSSVAIATVISDDDLPSFNQVDNEQRRKLIEVQDSDYAKSLKADQSKDKVI